MLKPILTALRATVVTALVAGVLFPLALYAGGQLLFKDQANGSLLHAADGRVVGSRWIGQAFTRPEYFHPRPSAAGNGYAGENSGGTNLAPTADKLLHGDKDFPGMIDLTRQYRTENGLDDSTPVPPDAVTRSASGLDPDISPENATLQAARVAKARNKPLQSIVELVGKHTEGRQFGVLGEARVNVLLLNLDLDEEKP